jgi:putative ABC transport system substrate-binding protein
MMQSIFYWLLTTILLITVSSATAQQPARIPRIGYLSGSGSSSNPGPYVEALRQGLHDLGYIDGKNIVIEYRGAEGKTDPIPSLVNELVQLKVDVLVVPPMLAAIRAAKQATKTIPIVMVTNSDPVATGLINSLARPGGNITGLATLTRELSGKRLELIKEAVPRVSRLAVLRDAESEGAAITLKEYEAVALSLKIPVQSLEVRGPNPDLAGAFQSAVKGRASALITITTSPLFRRQKQIAELAIKSRLPFDVRRQYLGRVRRPDVLLDRRPGGLSPRGHLRRQNSQRRQAGRHSSGATDEVRVRHQCENRETDRPNYSAVSAVPGGSGDPVKRKEQGL